MNTNKWDEWDRLGEDVGQPNSCKTGPLRKRLREETGGCEVNESEYRVTELQRKSYNTRWHCPTIQCYIALTCWGSLGRTGGQGIHNGSCGPSQAPQCTAAGWTHGSCQSCPADRWSWGAHTQQSGECRPALYWSSLTASSEMGGKERSHSWRHFILQNDRYYI